MQALSFNRQADELESWMDDVEVHLSSEDHGKDIISVSNLLKKHQVQWLRCIPCSLVNLGVTLGPETFMSFYPTYALESRVGWAPARREQTNEPDLSFISR